MNRALNYITVSLLVIVTFPAASIGSSDSSPLSQPIPLNYFGMHIHLTVTANGMDPLRPWPSVPIPELRLWDAGVAWPNIEPRKGAWNFSELDVYLNLAEEHKTNVLLTIGLSPGWASARPAEPSISRPGLAAEPRDLEDWRTYVATVATHCKGRVGEYEIWNEPNLKGYWTGDVDKLILLTREASEIIRRVDPQAIIVSPSATGSYGTKWLAEFLSKGGGQYVDVIGYHFYVNPEPPEAMVPIIQDVRQIMNDHGAGGKPLWNTELGWSKPKPFPSDELAGAYLARAYILNWVTGVERLYWYGWDNHGWVSIETTEADNRTLKPAGKAYGILQQWLVGSRIVECSADADHTWTCELNRRGTPRWIVWNVDRTEPFVPPVSWHARRVTPLLEEGRNTTTNIFISPIPELFE